MTAEFEPCGGIVTEIMLVVIQGAVLMKREVKK
jgi:hypothetical protein